MKYIVVIMDGAAGLPLAQRDNKTSLELAHTPNLSAMVREGMLGIARTVPQGMEPSSACACMSVLGYDPRVYYKGRAGIEARSLGIPVGKDEVVFRCNLVAVNDGCMWDYSAGHISTEESRELITYLNEKMGSDDVKFYPGVSYRHILKLKGQEDTLKAECTPPHDIPGKLIAEHLPTGPGSRLLRELMAKSVEVLQEHPINKKKVANRQPPASMIWLFWGSGDAPTMPPFEQVYGVSGVMSSGVDLLRGLARLMSMDVVNIKGVTDGLDNDYAAQAEGCLQALDKYDLAVAHIEAPDESGHGGEIDNKVQSIEKIDSEVLSRIRAWSGDKLRVLVMPDHPTPISIRTHTPDPVPFVLWGEGFSGNGGRKYTEEEARKTDFFIQDGYNIMTRLTGGMK